MLRLTNLHNNSTPVPILLCYLEMENFPDVGKLVVADIELLEVKQILRNGVKTQLTSKMILSERDPA